MEKTLGLYLLRFMLFIGFMNVVCGQKLIDCQQQIAIVRLYINKPKLDFLKNGYSKSTLNKDRIFYETQIKKHEESRKLYVEKVMYHFRQNYISPQLIRFIPDSLWHDFQNGVERPYYLDDEGKLSSEIIQPNKLNYYILSRGSYDEDFVALDQNGNILPPPFPSKIRHSILSKLNTLVGDGMKTTIERYCKQLKKYCLTN